MRIGLVGEAPNDTMAIKNLLLKNYPSDRYNFFDMLDNISGSLLDNQKTKRLLRIEYEIKKPDCIIFIRDLDGLITDRKKLHERRHYFTSSNRVVDKKGIYLLHIYEIEALILANINVFNDQYNTEIDLVQNPMTMIEPKERLKSFSRKYNEIHNGELFKKLDFQTSLECIYFAKFIRNFDKVVGRFFS